MAVILTEVNGVLMSNLIYGYLRCDHECSGCLADGRCKAQNDNNKAMADYLNSDEFHEKEKAQRDAWFAEEVYPSGPEHCWGCADNGNCSREAMLACLGGEHDERYDNSTESNLDCPF